jgi:hypothetical protein
LFTVQGLHFEEGEEEDIYIGKSNNSADSKFDQIIGEIEDIIIGKGSSFL